MGLRGFDCIKILVLFTFFLSCALSLDCPHYSTFCDSFSRCCPPDWRCSTWIRDPSHKNAPCISCLQCNVTINPVIPSITPPACLIDTNATHSAAWNAAHLQLATCSDWAWPQTPCRVPPSCISAWVAGLSVNLPFCAAEIQSRCRYWFGSCTDGSTQLCTPPLRTLSLPWGTVVVVVVVLSVALFTLIGVIVYLNRPVPRAVRDPGNAPFFDIFDSSDGFRDARNTVEVPLAPTAAVNASARTPTVVPGHYARRGDPPGSAHAYDVSYPLRYQDTVTFGGGW